MDTPPQPTTATASPTLLFLLAFLFLPAGMLATLLLFASANWLGFFPGNQASQSATATCHASQKPAAEQLLRGLFPNMQMLDARQLTPDQGCLLEVEMRVDKTVPGTQGFVYVLPNGEGFLNGPLLTKDSQLGVHPSNVETPAIDPGDTAIAADLERLQMLAELSAMLSGKSSDSTNIEPPSPASMTIETALAEVSQLANQVVFHPQHAKPVYVVFDPRCPSCKHQFLIQDEIAKTFGARIVWIPTYGDEQSRHLAAHIVKALEEGQAKARMVVNRIYNDQAGAAALLDQQFGHPEIHHYVQLDRSAQYLRSMMAEQELGTPLVLFESDKGSNHAVLFNGFAPVADFAEYLD